MTDEDWISHGGYHRLNNPDMPDMRQTDEFAGRAFARYFHQRPRYIGYRTMPAPLKGYALPYKPYSREWPGGLYYSKRARFNDCPIRGSFAWRNMK